MFYFNNPEDRNHIWHRGPWHFDRSLIVLEKPEGTGNISQLSFNKVEFWVQIHDIPIMCMNRRTAKWLAEQIGKLDTLENIVVVGLKYERLPKFCYACGRVGHGINECTDVEAKKEAIEGPMTKFGSWLRVSSIEKVKFKSPSQSSGGLSVKERSLDDLRELENKRTPTMEMSSLAIQKGGSESSATATPKKAVEKPLDTLFSEERAGNDKLDKMCVDGPLSGPTDLCEIEAHVFKESSSGVPNESLSLLTAGPSPLMTKEHPNSPSKQFGVQVLEQEANLKVHTNSKAKGKKWKRAAKDAQRKTKTGLMASPLQRKLMMEDCKGVVKESGGACGASLPRAMIGLCWNVRGLGNPCTFTALKRLLKKHSLNLVFLSETKMGSNRAGQIKEALGYEGGFGVDSNGSSGGLLLIWKEYCRVSVMSFCAGFNSSDHRPLLMVCESNMNEIGKIEKRFQFETFWLKKDDIGSVVTEIWEKRGTSNSIGDLRAKLDRCAVKLTGWSRTRFGNIRKQIEEKNREIENLYKKCKENGVM
ncbi:hypothetical protein EZV62_015131 [Acer yangbiense]|uniref:CCHC-type domain-containing protein n=1 Tax=Acer yangbiense TaxID=1000413 RepID=A0A5C7HUP3_9ROSI|nr:hypothetical protein EZV62_015131 [Acer yangbiense]